MKKLEWRATVAVAPNYPVTIHQSIFVCHAKNGFIGLPSGNFSNSDNWNDTGSGLSSRLLPAPYKLLITWLSYTEAKFYSGAFDLPEDRINELFKEGCIDWRKTHRDYDEVAVGLAPEGAVFVWVVGNGKKVEIGRYQAEAVYDIGVKDLAPGSSYTGKYNSVEEWCTSLLADEPEVHENLAKNGLGNGLWDRYRNRFRFKVVIDYVADGKGITDGFELVYYNGEEDTYNLDLLANYTYEDKAMVKEIAFCWSNDQDAFSGEISFDEQEMFEAYGHVWGGNPHQDGELVIRITPDDRIYNVSLRNRDVENPVEVVLEKAQYRSNPLPDINRDKVTVFKDQYKNKK